MKENRLINEKSPYLLQHAHNPIDWYTWCDEAFEKAINEDKPIFLSIGYSTCHWCHVMAHENFADNDIAHILNNNFINIKVDKEEHPDIDSIYMNYCRAYTGSGGWPLTIIMTPQGEPFFGETYIPKLSTEYSMGLLDLLNKVTDLWTNNRATINEDCKTLHDYVANLTSPKPPCKIDNKIYSKALRYYKNFYDPIYGGFGSYPKFPSPNSLYALLYIGKKINYSLPLDMVETTLESMYRGGIFDHLGGGFSRYSVDSMWLVPHFEKMLYDNALLAQIYSKFYSITEKALYREVAEKTFNYMLRVLKSPEGGFYCGEDADSEGVEGKFYVFDYDEVLSVLGHDDGETYCRRFSITQSGNFEGKNVFHLIYRDLDIHYLVKEKYDELSEKLFNYRENRVHPGLDDKILTSWNGLIIEALAYGGRILNNEEYINSSKACANFILNNLIINNKLYRCYRKDHVYIEGLLEDYSFLISGLLELYKATLDNDYLTHSINLTKTAIELFYDESNGGFFTNNKFSNKLICNLKESYDGAIPSGNSVMVGNLLKLHNLIPNDEFLTIAEKTLNFFSGDINENPSNYSMFLIYGNF